MSTIVINLIEPNLVKQLEQRATRNGHLIEEEIKLIIQNVLEEEPKNNQINIDLATTIKQRFAFLDDVEIPEIPRDPMRTPPQF
jgi:plasmid stability protein